VYMRLLTFAGRKKDGARTSELHLLMSWTKQIINSVILVLLSPAPAVAIRIVL
jgi:hypothetical protein